jgi:hypothetical protein
VAAAGSRLVAGALGWLLVLLGSFGVITTLLRELGGGAPTSTAGSAVALAASLSVVVVGLYGNPRVRDALQSLRS